MPKLVYTREELLAEHDYPQPHIEAGYKLHGGLDENGEYISTRTLNRWPAVRAWQEQLQAKGLPLIDADTQLLSRENYPNRAQQKFLLQHGLGETLWDGLTITGVIEARGQLLCQYPAPDLQKIIVEDISHTCAGHLNKGLLYAHGMDEGGDPDHPEIGAHDAMWFAVRDMVFGKDAYPIPEIPESIARPDEGRLFPQLPEEYEGLISLLMNVLMIEVRAESFFGFCCAVFRDPDLFTDRREAAEKAAQIVERIREDEAIHVAYLQTVVSELRGFTFKTVDGGTVKGADIIDPAWAKMVEWHAETRADAAEEQGRSAIARRIAALPNADKVLAEFDALADRKIAA